MNDEPLALIEYWAVDPDYDGEVFRSVWQDYRATPRTMTTRCASSPTAVSTCPLKDGPRTVCVRAVDVFGFESEVVIDGRRGVGMSAARISSRWPRADPSGRRRRSPTSSQAAAVPAAGRRSRR